METINKGDIFKVGDHVIACGDCLDSNFVRKVIGINKIRAVITDPPYGVAYVENKKDFVNLAVKNNKVIAGDHLQSDEEYRKFTKDWLSCVTPHLEKYNTCYIFNCDLMYPALRLGMKDAGYFYSQMLVWLKNQPVMGRKDYLSMFELIAYGWHGKHKAEYSVGKNVIFHPRPVKSSLHPTQKPVGLLRKIIPHATKLHEYVYDPFLGSGTTAVACEHLRRRCVGIELDPEYVRKAITRLETLTKVRAVKVV